MKLRFTLSALGLCLVGVVTANAQTQQSAPPPIAPGTLAMVQSSAPSSTITNARVIEMAKLGLDDDVIIARIKHGVCEFALSDADLVELKKEGVSSKVVAAMLESVPVASATPVQEPNDGKVRAFVTDSQSWETRGAGGGGGNRNDWGASSSFSGGARPQTAE